MNDIEQRAAKLLGWKIGSERGLLKIIPTTAIIETRNGELPSPTDREELAWRVICDLVEIQNGLAERVSSVVRQNENLLREVEALRKEHEAAEPLVKYFETFSAGDFNLDDIIKHRAAHAAAKEKNAKT